MLMEIKKKKYVLLKDQVGFNFGFNTYRTEVINQTILRRRECAI